MGEKNNKTKTIQLYKCSCNAKIKLTQSLERTKTQNKHRLKIETNKQTKKTNKKTNKQTDSCGYGVVRVVGYLMEHEITFANHDSPPKFDKRYLFNGSNA